MFLTTLNAPPSSCHQALGRNKLLFLPSSILSKICFPQQQKVVEETMICFSKTQSENMKMINVMALHFCKKYLSYSMVLILLLLLCNHDSSIIKLHQKRSSYLDEGWLFIGSFKVRSLHMMIYKEVLAQFLYITNSKIVFPVKLGKIVTLCMLQKEGR